MTTCKVWLLCSFHWFDSFNSHCISPVIFLHTVIIWSQKLSWINYYLPCLPTFTCGLITSIYDLFCQYRLKALPGDILNFRYVNKSHHKMETKQYTTETGVNSSFVSDYFHRVVNHIWCFSLVHICGNWVKIMELNSTDKQDTGYQTHSLILPLLLFSHQGKGEAVCGAEAHPCPAAWSRGSWAAPAVPVDHQREN